MKLLTKLTSILDRAIDCLAVIAAVILVWVILWVCAEVVMRYFLNRPLIWVVEVSEISLLYITFLGTAWVLKREGHVKMEIVLNRLRPRTQALLGIMSSIIRIGICCILVWYGAQVTWDHWLRGAYRYTVLETPNYLVLLIIPIGSFLLFIQFLRRTYKYFGEFRAPPEPKQRKAVETTQ